MTQTSNEQGERRGIGPGVATGTRRDVAHLEPATLLGSSEAVASPRRGAAFGDRAGANALYIDRFAVLIDAGRGNASDKLVAAIDVEHQDAMPWT